MVAVEEPVSSPMVTSASNKKFSDDDLRPERPGPHIVPRTPDLRTAEDLSGTSHQKSRVWESRDSSDRNTDVTCCIPEDGITQPK